ncbi:efflux transporter outer membrane subunit [Flammeovirga kamogawensis]|uniref:TolC family protein n=1 Tax=Flammeovirga kamogawensis TaxID=373891 RepID=A0ABX8GQC5_9BACT|nr:TolC family protein [Flammeovirga kamogawensis]MBB6462050.1 multidrug efflux system outer membrane protein [Flammeovirga kamogawensis]QWG05785.1 TolC family protein [Flammeovirga kamogawensis]
MEKRLNLNYKNILLVFFVSQLIWGCKMGKNYEAPEVDTPLEYRFGSDTTISVENDTIGWWVLVKDPTLDSLIATGLRNNQDVKVAMQRIIEAEKLARIQKVSARPMFGYNGNYSYGNYSGFVGPNANNNYFGGASLNWEIDLWGKNRRLTEAAQANYLGSVYGARALQITLISQITTAYVRLLENKASLQVAIETLSSRDSSMIIMNARYTQGTIPEIDLNQAQIQQAIAESAIPVYKRGVALSENTLSILLGENPKAIITGEALEAQALPPVIPSGLPSDLLKRRPDLLKAEQEIVAQNAQVGAAIANRFPTISLTGTAGIASDALFSANAATGAWNIGAGVVGPLFQWGKNKRRVEAEKAKLEASIYQYESSIISAFKEVEDALASIQFYNEELIAREKHTRAALNAERLSKQRYDKGVTSYLEYLEQQRQAFEAELNLVTVRSNILSSYIQLYKALGGGWISREEQQEAESNESANK